MEADHSRKAETIWDGKTRPEADDMLDGRYDLTGPAAPRHKIIICAAPRSSSNRLGRLLFAAGLGLPVEYFHHRYLALLTKRWGLDFDPRKDRRRPWRRHRFEPGLSAYLDALLARRSPGGVFATKLQFWQFRKFLANDIGRRLFEGAVVVYLFRPDVAGQIASHAAAMASGRWEFGEVARSAPSGAAASADEERLIAESFKLMLAEDCNWRRFFAASAIQPIFATSSEVNTDPRTVVDRIAATVGAPVTGEALEAMIGLDSRYEVDRDRKERFLDLLRTQAPDDAFDRRTYR